MANSRRKQGSTHAHCFFHAQNTAVYGPITFEEIVIVMIKAVVNMKRIEEN